MPATLAPACPIHAAAGRSLDRITFVHQATSALSAENVTWPQYAILLALASASAPPTVAGVAIAIGYSYHAVRNQALRSYLFELDTSGHLARIRITHDGRDKLARITARLATHA